MCGCRATPIAVIAASVVVLVAGAAGRATAQRVACSEVIAFANQLTTESPKKSHDPIYIGRRLDINALWVERCLVAHGRRVTRHVQMDDATREKLEERWESGPHEEVAREESEAATDTKTENRRKGLPEAEQPSGWEGFGFGRGEGSSERRTNR